MQNTTYESEQPACDIRQYGHEALATEFPQFDAATTDVELSYRSADGKHEHVLIPAGTKNLYLVVVISIESKAIFGHFVLDLNREYGLTPGSE
jgi:hypothetical protein